MTHDLRKKLYFADLKRAEARRHKSCASHGRVRIVCQGCVRVFCPLCRELCPRCHRPHTIHYAKELTKRLRGPLGVVRPTRQTPAGRPIPPPLTGPLKVVADALRPMGLLTVEHHPDSGEWMAVFPFQLSGFSSAELLAEAVYRALPPVAERTPFGSGRLFHPDYWYVTFRVKE